MRTQACECARCESRFGQNTKAECSEAQDLSSFKGTEVESEGTMCADWSKSKQPQIIACPGLMRAPRVHRSHAVLSGLWTYAHAPLVHRSHAQGLRMLDMQPPDL